MSKATIEFQPDLIGKTLSDFQFDWCKGSSTGENKDTSNITMSENGYGVYVLNLDEMSEDIDFRIHLISDPDTYQTGTFTSVSFSEDLSTIKEFIRQSWKILREMNFYKQK